MEQQPKPARQSKTIQFNALAIILYPVIRQLIIAGLAWLATQTGLDLSLGDDDLNSITDAILTWLPEAVALLPLAIGNIYLRLVTTEPVTLAGFRFEHIGARPQKPQRDDGI